MACCSDNSPESPKPPPRSVPVSPQFGAALRRTQQENQGSQQQTSPSRPSSLPVTMGTPPSSQPIPVPSQVQAYQRMQRSLSSPGTSSNSLAAMAREIPPRVSARTLTTGKCVALSDFSSIYTAISGYLLFIQISIKISSSAWSIHIVANIAKVIKG